MNRRTKKSKDSPKTSIHCFCVVFPQAPILDLMPPPVQLVQPMQPVSQGLVYPRIDRQSAWVECALSPHLVVYFMVRFPTDLVVSLLR